MESVEIITIGDELLIGQVVDTNSAWMGRELNKIGFEVKNKVTVGDNEREIEKAFDRAFLRSSIILVTGGIGPTNDDVTRKTLCKYFDCGLRFDGEVLKNMEEIFRRLGREINPLTYGQAYVPEACTVIPNQVGTAPATWFEKDGKILVSMPGVPYEMKWLMQEEILKRLKDRFSQHSYIRHLVCWVEGYTESALALHIEDFEKELPGDLHLAYLPNAGLIRLRLSGKGDDEQKLLSLMNEQSEKLRGLLKDCIVAEGDETIEAFVGEMLKKKSLTISTAESCTGGNIARTLTSIPGSSVYFKGGVVAYANDIKVNVLQVDPSDIEKEGAVSETVVRQMAANVAKLMNTDCSIAVSGIAGPDGGTSEKPVGTIWIAVSCQDRMKTKKIMLSNSREANVMRASNAALLTLYRLLKEI